MDETKRQIEVMKAYEEGKAIQYRGKCTKDDVWNDTKFPSWNWYSVDYRIKPEEPEEPKKLMTNRQLFMNSKEKERRYQNIKISIKKLNGDDFEVESEPDEETIKDYSDCYSVEPKIGEVFRYKGLTLRCEEGGCGDGCALVKLPCYAFDCIKSQRVDGKGVRFVDVSKKEKPTASEDSSSTQKEGVGIHKRTPQEFADFFGCYVAMDEDGYLYLYNEEPIIGKGDFSWSTANCGTGEILSVSEGFLLLNAEEDHNWRTLYRPHREPLVMEEEDDD